MGFVRCSRSTEGLLLEVGCVSSRMKLTSTKVYPPQKESLLDWWLRLSDRRLITRSDDRVWRQTSPESTLISYSSSKRETPLGTGTCWIYNSFTTLFTTACTRASGTSSRTITRTKIKVLKIICEHQQHDRTVVGVERHTGHTLLWRGHDAKCAEQPLSV